MTNEEMMKQMLQVMQSMQQEIAELKASKATSKSADKVKTEAPKAEKKDFNSLSLKEQVEVEKSSVEWYKQHNKSAIDLQVKECDPEKGVTFVAVYTSKWTDKKTGKAKEAKRIVVRLFDKSPNYGSLVSKFSEINCKEYFDRWNNKPLITKTYSDELFKQIMGIVKSVMKPSKKVEAPTPKAVAPKVEEDLQEETEDAELVEEIVEVEAPKAKKKAKTIEPSVDVANRVTYLTSGLLKEDK